MSDRTLFLWFPGSSRASTTAAIRTISPAQPMLWLRAPESPGYRTPRSVKNAAIRLSNATPMVVAQPDAVPYPGTAELRRGARQPSPRRGLPPPSSEWPVRPALGERGVREPKKLSSGL